MARKAESKAKKVYREALALSEAEREELVRLLAPQGDDWIDPEIEQAWIKEAERRDRAVAEGREQLIPGDEVMQELRKIVSG